MYKTYFTYNRLITKAENINDALTKFTNYLRTHHYHYRLKLDDLYELNKTAVIDLSNEN